MPAAKKATKASQTKTSRAKKAVKAAPKVKAKVRAAATAPPGHKRVVAFKAVGKPAAGEPRNIIMELWKAKEEKRRNEAPHTKFHQTGPPSGSHASHVKHDRFARYAGPRRRAS